MKIANIALAALLTVSSVQTYAANSSSQNIHSITPQQLLAAQYGELQDLESQLSKVEASKSTAKTVLYVSGAATAAGAVLALVAMVGGMSEVLVGAISNSVQRDSYTDSADTVVKMVNAGGIIFVGGAAGTVASTGYLVYLNLTQVKKLKKQIQTQKAVIEATLQQLN